ncbi:MAG: response regulator [Candidatus Methylomirabilia bacterium]
MGVGVGRQSAAVQKKILIVDAYPHSLEGLKYSLASTGGRIETAADGWEAIKKGKEGGFEVAIIDLDLPPLSGLGLNGWDLMRILRSFNPAMAIIAVCADGSVEVRAQAAQLGVSRFLEKPIDLAELRELVRAVGP